jgi:hypothetical protein
MKIYSNRFPSKQNDQSRVLCEATNRSTQTGPGMSRETDRQFGAQTAASDFPLSLGAIDKATQVWSSGSGSPGDVPPYFYQMELFADKSRAPFVRTISEKANIGVFTKGDNVGKKTGIATVRDVQRAGYMAELDAMKARYGNAYSFADVRNAAGGVVGCLVAPRPVTDALALVNGIDTSGACKSVAPSLQIIAKGSQTLRTGERFGPSSKPVSFSVPAGWDVDPRSSGRTSGLGRAAETFELGTTIPEHRLQGTTAQHLERWIRGDMACQSYRELERLIQMVHREVASVGKVSRRQRQDKNQDAEAYRCERAIAALLKLQSGLDDLNPVFVAHLGHGNDMPLSHFMKLAAVDKPYKGVQLHVSRSPDEDQLKEVRGDVDWRRVLAKSLRDIPDILVGLPSALVEVPVAASLAEMRGDSVARAIERQLFPHSMRRPFALKDLPIPVSNVTDEDRAAEILSNALSRTSNSVAD